MYQLLLTIFYLIIFKDVQAKNFGIRTFPNVDGHVTYFIPLAKVHPEKVNQLQTKLDNIKSVRGVETLNKCSCKKDQNIRITFDKSDAIKRCGCTKKVDANIMRDYDDFKPIYPYTEKHQKLIEGLFQFVKFGGSDEILNELDDVQQRYILGLKQQGVNCPDGELRKYVTKIVYKKYKGMIQFLDIRKAYVVRPYTGAMPDKKSLPLTNFQKDRLKEKEASKDKEIQ